MSFPALLTRCGAIRATRLTIAYALVGMGSLYLCEPNGQEEGDALRRSLLGVLLIFLGYNMHAGSIGQPGMPRAQQRSLLGGMRDDLFGDTDRRRYTAASAGLLGLSAYLTRLRWGTPEGLVFLTTGFGMLPHAMHRATALHCSFAALEPGVIQRSRPILLANHALAVLLDISAFQVGRHGAMLLRWLATDLGVRAFRVGPGGRAWYANHDGFDGRQLVALRLVVLLFCRSLEVFGQMVETSERDVGPRTLFSHLPFYSMRGFVRMVFDPVYGAVRARASGPQMLNFVINEVVYFLRERPMRDYTQAYPHGVTTLPLVFGQDRLAPYEARFPAAAAGNPALPLLAPAPAPVAVIQVAPAALPAQPGPGPAQAGAMRGLPPWEVEMLEEFRILIRLPVLWADGVAQDGKVGSDAKRRPDKDSDG